MPKLTSRVAEKPFRDFLVLQTLEAAIRYDISLQLPTGVGDSPIIDLRLSNPLLLFNMLTDKHYGQAKYVMVHSSYPYAAETGFLAAFGCPGVDTWLDVALGWQSGHFYSRNTNPTLQAFEEKVRILEDAEAATSFSTEMAAISNTLFTLLSPGDRIVSVKDGRNVRLPATARA
jgi:hypothetical protein